MTEQEKFLVEGIRTRLESVLPTEKFVPLHEPYFVGKDVAAILGYSNSRKALADHLEEDEKDVTVCYTPGGEQTMNVINESGLYCLILRSNMPKAKEFRKWVTATVLPQVMRIEL